MRGAHFEETRDRDSGVGPQLDGRATPHIEVGDDLGYSVVPSRQEHHNDRTPAQLREFIGWKRFRS
jgi:hypothetical protein